MCIYYYSYIKYFKSKKIKIILLEKLLFFLFYFQLYIIYSFFRIRFRIQEKIMEQKRVIFISLLLDLLAFTLILPLFPKIYEFYGSNENVIL
jgi:hypothetical protein